jgi:hypothetical protein
MAKFTWQNVRLFAGSADLTTVNNKVEVKAEAERQDATAFSASGVVWKETLLGVRSTEIAAEGQWEAGDLSKVDNVSFADLGSVTPWMVGPESADVSSLAYLTGLLRGEYQLGGSIGDVAPWTASGEGTYPLVRGVVGHPPGTARTASGTGTALEMTAVSATQSLYAGLHVLSVAGTSTPTLTVRIESDVDTGFGSAVTVGTFTAATALTSQFLEIPGAITDDCFRVAWTISGTNPSFLFLVSLGIA